MHSKLVKNSEIEKTMFIRHVFKEADDKTFFFLITTHTNDVH